MSMDDDMNFFAAPPPAVQPSGSGDDFGMGDDSGAPAPIVLGGGDDYAGAGGGDDAMAPPMYLGDVNETNSFEDSSPPIVLVPSEGGGDNAGYSLGGEPVLVEQEADDETALATATSEPSAMTKWNAEWQELLLVRKDEENARRAELVEAARLALEQFAAEREHKREAKMAKNREDEQAKLEAIEADLENDNSWQKVCKMVELSHDSTKQAQDVKRMRDILILLKNTPAKATALGA
jgi:Clathrin light chain